MAAPDPRQQQQVPPSGRDEERGGTAAVSARHKGWRETRDGWWAKAITEADLKNGGTLNVGSEKHRAEPHFLTPLCTYHTVA